MDNEQNIKLTADEMFKALKEKKQIINDSDLNKFYDSCINKVKKYMITNQKYGLRKLEFMIHCVEKERSLINMGINKFIYKDDIEDYVDNVAKKDVFITELENFSREIPDEIVETISKCKDIFDQFYIVYTDYTKKEAKRIATEKRSSDPIVFGAFQDDKKQIMNDRFYYLGDWIDEYCDLTLDKLVYETRENIVKEINPTPITDDALLIELSRLNEKNRITDEAARMDRFISTNGTKKKTFFQKIRSVFNHES